MEEVLFILACLVIPLCFIWLLAFGKNLKLKLENSSLSKEDIRRILKNHGVDVYDGKKGKLQIRGAVAMLNLTIEAGNNCVLVKGGRFISVNPEWACEHRFQINFVPFYGLIYYFRRRSERKELFSKIAEILKNSDAI